MLCVKIASSERDQRIWKRNVLEHPQGPWCAQGGACESLGASLKFTHSPQGASQCLVVSGYDRILDGNASEDLEDSVVLSYSCLIKISSLKGSPQVGAIQGKSVTMHNEL